MKIEDKLLEEIMESNLSTPTKVELTKMLTTRKSKISDFIYYVVLRFGLDKLFENQE